MALRKAFKYRLYPTRPQARDLERTLSLCRSLYNAALQERRDAYRKVGRTVGFYERVDQAFGSGRERNPDKGKARYFLPGSGPSG